MTDRELQARMRQALDKSMPPLPDDPDLTAKVLDRYAGKRQKKRARLSGMRIAAAAVVMALVVCGGAIMQSFSYTYVDARQSEDGEQYILIGVSVTPPVGQTADAATDHGDWSMFYTEDWDEVVEALGEAPLMPAWLPDGWEISGYDVIIDNTQKCLSTYYEKPRPGEEDTDVLIYHVNAFTDLQYLNMAIEANNEGESIELENGLSVYVDLNVKRTTSMWQDGLTGYSMSGDVTKEELMRVIRSIYGLD